MSPSSLRSYRGPEAAEESPRWNGERRNGAHESPPLARYEEQQRNRYNNDLRPIDQPNAAPALEQPVRVTLLDRMAEPSAPSGVTTSTFIDVATPAIAALRAKASTMILPTAAGPTSTANVNGAMVPPPSSTAAGGQGITQLDIFYAKPDVSPRDAPAYLPMDAERRSPVTLSIPGPITPSTNAQWPRNRRNSTSQSQQRSEPLHHGSQWQSGPYAQDAYAPSRTQEPPSLVSRIEPRPTTVDTQPQRNLRDRIDTGDGGGRGGGGDRVYQNGGPSDDIDGYDQQDGNRGHHRGRGRGRGRRGGGRGRGERGGHGQGQRDDHR
jgi:hypothetical protein